MMGPGQKYLYQSGQEGAHPLASQIVDGLSVEVMHVITDGRDLPRICRCTIVPKDPKEGCCSSLASRCSLYVSHLAATSSNSVLHPIELLSLPKHVFSVNSVGNGPLLTVGGIAHGPFPPPCPNALKHHEHSTLLLCKKPVPIISSSLFQVHPLECTCQPSCCICVETHASF
jgi:hypothetical protein